MCKRQTVAVCHPLAVLTDIAPYLLKHVTRRSRLFWVNFIDCLACPGPLLTVKFVGNPLIHQATFTKVSCPK